MIKTDLKNLLSKLHLDLKLSSAAEIKEGCELIITAQSLSHTEVEVLKASYEHGPLFDGDVPSKSGRDSLIDKGLIVKTVVKGEDGFNACSHAGAWVYRLIKE